MPIFILSVIVQVAFVVHIVKTGRNTTWIWIVIALPVAGSIAYFIVEVLPGLGSSHTARRTKKTLVNTLNPNKDLNQAVQNYTLSDTVENTMKLAAECLNKEKYAEAKSLYERCLIGIHKDDPELMQGLASAEFKLGEFEICKGILDDLIAKNPDYKSPDAHLLYARSLEELGETQEALHEYEALDKYFPGPEATYRYAKLLQAIQQQDKAIELYEKIMVQAQQAGNHYNNIYGQWIKLAKAQL